MAGAGNKRMAVLVGCNYANTENELNGCINDVLAMRGMLLSRFGFQESRIELMTDEPESEIMPTGANIKKALNEMVDEAEEGDIIFFQYSGHGTWIPSSTDPSRQDEAIVPCDFNLITDVDFRQLVNRLPEGANLTILSDSCHSGGLINKEKEQIGPSSVAKYHTTFPSHISRSKAIPLESITQHLSSLTDLNTSDIGTHSLECFGADASLKFHIQSRGLNDIKLRKPDEGILLSGCQANETSADMSPEEGVGESYGAFTNALLEVLKKNPDRLLSNKEVVMMVREVLREQGFEQHPCLYCSDENADAIFLEQPDVDDSSYADEQPDDNDSFYFDENANEQPDDNDSSCADEQPDADDSSYADEDADEQPDDNDSCSDGNVDEQPDGDVSSYADESADEQPNVDDFSYAFDESESESD